MKMRIHILFLVVLVCLGTSCTKETIEATAITTTITGNAVLEQAVLEVVNDHRVAMGYTALVINDAAYKLANAHTDYMISKGELSHDNFSARAKQLSEEAGAELVSENVAKDYETAQEAFDKWISSEQHRTAIEGDFTKTAISVKKDSNGHFYYTQIFFR